MKAYISHKITGYYETDEYFAVIYHCSNKDDIANGVPEYSFISQGNASLLEMSCDSQANYVMEVRLICSNKFRFYENTLSLPNFEEKYVGFKLSRNMYCDDFFVDVYSDGIHINFHTEKARFYAKCGDLIFGFGKNRKITDIYFTNMSKDAIENAKEVWKWEHK